VIAVLTCVQATTTSYNIYFHRSNRERETSCASSVGLRFAEPHALEPVRGIIWREDGAWRNSGTELTTCSISPPDQPEPLLKDSLLPPLLAQTTLLLNIRYPAFYREDSRNEPNR
jgi:hypothetical protein